jgi:hypothetical protein
MRRFQVANGVKAWTDEGPDLLRARPRAVHAAGKLLAWREKYVGRVLHASTKGEPWDELGSRRKALKWLDAALEGAHAGDRVQIGIQRWSDVEVRAVVRTTEVTITHLEGATPDTEIVNALYQSAFPKSLFAGAYVCKEIEGTSDYSDHAWGDAVDRTATDGAPNDAMTDWGARMAADKNMTVAYILGSRNGDVVQADKRLVGNWRLRPSDASSSHLWHVHTSIRKHTGTPPCAR